MLVRRAGMLARTRAFFAERGVLEVETPALSTAGTSDPAVDSVTAHLRAAAALCYLHTSPEHAMKRLLAADSGDIYQLCRVFRDGEVGRWHQPEFTLLEWYRVGWDEHRLMDEVDALLEQLLADRLGHPASRRRYADAFAAALGAAPDAPLHALTAALKAHGIDAPAGLTHDAALDLALSCVVAPTFDPAALTFIYDFPPSAAALAEINATDPPTAARFEVFCGAVELANGFRELTDAAEHRRRFEADLEQRRAAGRPAPPIDEALLAALDRLPPSAGVAVGFDRVVALAAGADDIAAALSFAWDSESP